MLLRKLVVVGLVGFVSFAANIATAEDALGPTATFAIDGVNFGDPSDSFADGFDIGLRSADAPRFSEFIPTDRSTARESRDDRRYELSVVTGSPDGVNVSFAQRGGFGFNANGEVDRETRGSELRIGRGLRTMQRDEGSPAPRWYLFAASEDEALIWGPGMRNSFGNASSSFALQDRVEVGDIQAGVTYEANGWQASLAYVEREISVSTGARTFHEDQNFAGFTLTMRH
jgi:hypothetical protein